MKEEAQKYSTVHYKDHLGLDKILNAQHLRSEQVDGNAAHEEMLFIIVHQAYELWFKQIIHELQSVIGLFKTDRVDERNIGTAIGRLKRVVEIEKLLISQLTIMETMTPLDFLDFRHHLFPASGFQSYQFRAFENLLGLKEDSRITYNGCPYSVVFTEENQQKLHEMTEVGTLYDAIETWLERTPFIELGDFDFLESYKEAVERMLKKEKTTAEEKGQKDGKGRKKRGRSPPKHTTVVSITHGCRVRATSWAVPLHHRKQSTEAWNRLGGRSQVNLNDTQTQKKQRL